MIRRSHFDSTLLFPLSVAASIAMGSAAAQDFQLGTPSLLTEVRGQASSPSLADMDGDGQLDGLFISSARDGVSMAPGQGNGNFGDPQAIAEEVGPLTGFWAVDLDGDNDLDLVAIAADKVYRVMNGGAGGYSSFEVLLDPTVLLGLRPVDANGDGLPDLAALRGPSVATRALEYYAGSAQGFATQPTPIGTGGSAFQAADVTGDGVLDFAVNLGSAVRIMAGVGGGTFAAPVDVTTVGGQAVGLLSQVADIDGDGIMDLVGRLSTERAFFRGLGGGTFADGAAFDTGNVTGLNGVLILDLDGDGDLDSLQFEGPFFGPFTATAYIQSAPWVFSAGVAIGLKEGDFAIADFNGDGLDDLLRTSLVGELSWHVGSGDAATGYFEDPRLLAPRLMEGFEDVVTADLDGDGDDDVIVRTESSQVGWIENVAPGVTASPVPLLESTLNLQSLHPLDFEGDGDVDLVLYGDELPQATRTFSVWLNDGSEDFVQGPGGSVPYVNGNSECIARDFDSDGDGDILVVAPEAGVIGVVPTLFLNGLSGAPFTERRPFAAGVRARSLDTGDFNGDGLVDLAFARLLGSGLYELSVLPGFGLGAFEPPVAVSGVVDGARVDVADFDGDGMDDILLADPIQGLSLWRRTGSLMFGNPIPLVPAGEFFDFQVIDFDSDGDQDLALARGASVVLGIQDEDGVVGDAFPLSVERLRLPLWLADVDGDGDGEAIRVDSSRDGIVAMENTGVQAVGSAFCDFGGGTLAAIGSAFVVDNNLTLRAQGLPPLQFGIAVGSRAFGPPVSVPGGTYFCLLGDVGRFDGSAQIAQSGANGVLTVDLDLGALELSNGSVPGMAGETWSFQVWHRNPGSAGPPSAFSTGVAVQLR